MEPMTGDEFIDYCHIQIDEIIKYKWCLGIILHHDPLNDYTMEEIANMWIEKYAKDFRIHWFETEHIKYIIISGHIE